MVTLMIGGMAVLACLAVVVTVVERIMQPRQRLVAVTRKELWLVRYGAHESGYDD